ncbi:MAG: hypothetical protein QNJ90_05030 [Planctomycetota bacterium]|nr:hypothetical protein [Planctomycetota bacterium]
MTHTDHHDPSDDARLQDLLDGRLDEAEASALRTRIEAEPALREAWEELRGIQALVRDYGAGSADLDEPADFLAGVRTRIRETASSTSAPEADTPQPRRRPGRMARMLTTAYAVAALLIVGFTVRYVLHDRPTTGDETRTAQEPVDRTPPPETSLEDDQLVKKDAPFEGAGPAGGIKDHGERMESEDADDAGRLAAKVRQPSPSPAPEPAPARARGGKPAGPFAAPGGAVPRGLRTPSDTKQPPPAARDDAGPAEERKQPEPVQAPPTRLARLLEVQASGDPVFVLEVADAAEGRRVLATLLATPATLDGKAKAGARQPRSKDPVAAPSADAETPDADTPEKGLLRFYRLEGAERVRLLASLRGARYMSGGAKKLEEDKEAKDGAGFVGERGDLLELVTRELDAPTLARLEKRAQGGVWGREVLARDARERRKARPPAPTTPAPTPSAPTRPAPKTPSVGKVGGDQPSAPVKKAKPVRVRILVLERR